MAGETAHRASAVSQMERVTPRDENAPVSEVV